MKEIAYKTIIILTLLVISLRAASDCHNISAYNRTDTWHLDHAFTLCLDKHYDEALHVFEKIVLESKDINERQNAELLAIYLLSQKKYKLDMDTYVRDYKLARHAYSAYIDSYYKIRLPNFNKENYYRCLGQYGTWNTSVVKPNKWCKKLPWYYKAFSEHDILCSEFYLEKLRRLPVEDVLFPFYKGGKFGYVDISGTPAIYLQFKFASPFDEKEGLAVVQHANGEWGYIDMKGNKLDRELTEEEKEKLESYRHLLINRHKELAK